MRNRLTVFIILAVSLVFGLLFARQMILGNSIPRENMTEGKLRILTYASFVSPSGPGGELIENFKKTCKCKVDVVTTSDAGLLLERLKLAPASAPFDVVIGLDQFMLNEASQQTKWRDVPVNVRNMQPEALVRGASPFIPYDWSPMSFVYRKGEVEPPRDFSGLLDARFKNKFALQDPRASTSGLQFVNWVRDVQGANAAEFLANFKPNVQSVSPSWSFAYGLFKKEQASFVFSYVTSLAYHWDVEKDMKYQIVSLPEGHPIQIEYAGVLDGCRECDLAVDFVQDLLLADNQKLIMKRNFMFPVVMGVTDGEVFEKLPKLKTRPPFNAGDKDLSDWDKVFKH